MLLPNLPSVTNDYAETLFHNINYNQKQCTLLELIIDLLKVGLNPHKPQTIPIHIGI